MKTAAIVIALLLGSHAQAQDGMFFDPSGQYQGSYSTDNFGTTTIFGPGGQVRETLQQDRFGTTTIFGPSGQFRGTIVPEPQIITPRRGY